MLSRLIWNQTEFHLVPNLHEEKYPFDAQYIGRNVMKQFNFMVLFNLKYSGMNLQCVEENKIYFSVSLFDE